MQSDCVPCKVSFSLDCLWRTHYPINVHTYLVLTDVTIFPWMELSSSSFYYLSLECSPRALSNMRTCSNYCVEQVMSFDAIDGSKMCKSICEIYLYMMDNTSTSSWTNVIWYVPHANFKSIWFYQMRLGFSQTNCIIIKNEIKKIASFYHFSNEFVQLRFIIIPKLQDREDAMQNKSRWESEKTVQ